MRFFCSDMPNPSSWIESNIADERAVITAYCYEHFEIYDADNSGEYTYYFAFDTAKYFKVEHIWWIELDPDWRFVNEYEITEVSKQEAKRVCEDRDWLRRFSRQHRMRKKRLTIWLSVPFEHIGIGIM